MKLKFIIGMTWHFQSCRTADDEIGFEPELKPIDDENNEVLKAVAGTRAMRKHLRMRLEDCMLYTIRLSPSPYLEILMVLEMQILNDITIDPNGPSIVDYDIGMRRPTCEVLVPMMTEFLEPALVPQKLAVSKVWKRMSLAA